MNYDHSHFLGKFGDDLSVEELKWIRQNGYINNPVYYGRLIELADEFSIENYNEKSFLFLAYNAYQNLKQTGDKIHFVTYFRCLQEWFDSLIDLKDRWDDEDYIKSIVDVHCLTMKVMRFAPKFFPDNTSDRVKNGVWRYYNYHVVRKDSVSISSLSVEEAIKLDLKYFNNKYPFKEDVKIAMRFAEVGKYREAINILDLIENRGHSVLNYSLDLKFKLGEDLNKDISDFKHLKPYKEEDFIWLLYLANMYFHAYIYTNNKNSDLLEGAKKYFSNAIDYYKVVKPHRSNLFYFNERGCRFTEPFFVISLTLYPYYKYILKGEKYE